MSKRKILPEEHPVIRDMVSKGVSRRQVAKLYGVSWGTIQFIVEPEKAERNRERMKERQRKLRNAITNATTNESRNGEMNDT